MSHFPKSDIFCEDEAATLVHATRLATLLKPGDIIYLQGPLGAGKTTFARGLIRALGFHGKVKSPSYTLVEPYLIAGQQIFHFDLYRLCNPKELLNIGLEDYLTADAICLIEWPEHALEILPAATRSVKIEIPKNGIGRRLTIKG